MIKKIVDKVVDKILGRLDCHLTGCTCTVTEYKHYTEYKCIDCGRVEKRWN
jgi:hypothetical protein